ncbi:hypothetical protein CHLNCDRAFT_144508 [Chlorella variabilis]|uniref:glutaredoxin-dependent peroxiredoxin n=1 Tax=Chlorella variabilis TaxID=554065 RepID=E1ZBK6_CHLVA|nr:hypothetical protein CHLNCDRAFT_144508 [Chlorella variabilis]EFN56660.1 hypothetical protein CHLNCDRAFT_144508 [Chlorella variabilis]|eukprot:XP_005848762.1 hypothetical protein CHLNCDRAFT_144508 [Chlorella variabilis]
MALIGKPCPTLSGLTFIKGDPVAVPSRSGPMVVEFWATWCGPCRAAFPHLSQLARKFRGSGLVVVGVNMEEDSPQIRAFGDKMDYRVAVDATGQAAQALMGAAQVAGIPHGFIIDAGGVVRHHGHPMEPKFAQVLESVCREPAASGGAAAAAPAPPQQQRELPPITSSRQELLALPVRQLKQVLEERGIGFADCNEKQELVDRIVERCSTVTYYTSK